MDGEPYVGPRSFEEKDGGRFFGRDREADDLVSLTFAHAAVLLYSQSGAGKTSLLQARLLPRLQQEGFEILPTVRVRVLESTGGAAGNPYVRNTLVSCSGEAVDAPALDGLSLSAFLQARPYQLRRGKEPSPRVLVFDQFEEVFTTGPWQARKDFFRQLGEALGADPLLRAILSLREEYLAHLDPYAALMPERLRCRFRLELLRRPAALKAVVGPLEGWNTRFADGVADALVTNLMRAKVQGESGDWIEAEGEFAEPVQLQVVCQSLWRDLPDGAAEITHDHLRDFGDVDEALTSFFERCIRETVEEKKALIQEGRLRGWFEMELITPSGTRGMVHQGKEETGGIPNAVVEKLGRLHLIRGEWRAGACWYELAHDRFIEPIRVSNRRWREERGIAEQTLRRLEERARQWRRGEGRPLDEVGLREAERCLAAAGREEIGASEALLSLVDASRSRQEQKLLRQLLWIAALVVLMLASLVVWDRLGQEEEERKRRITQSEQLAEAARAVGFASSPRGLLLAVEAARIAQGAGQERPPAAESALRWLLARTEGFPVAGPGEWPLGYAASADGRWLATSDRDGKLRLRGLSREGLERPATVLEGMQSPLVAVAVSPDERWVLASGMRQALLWDRGSRGVPQLLDMDGQPVERPILGPGGQWLLDAPPFGALRLWRLEGGRLRPASALRCPRGLIARSALDSGLRRVAAACEDGTVLTWELTAGGPKGAPEPLRGLGRVSRLAVDPSGRWIAASGPDGEVRAWDLQTGKGVSQRFRGVSFLEFTSRSGLIVDPEDGPPLSWDLERGAETRVLPGAERGEVRALSASGLRLLLSEEGTLVVRDVHETEGRGIILAHPGKDAMAARFSADGAWLLTETKDGEVRLWDLSTRGPSRAEPASFGPALPMGTLAVDPTGARLATSGPFGGVEVWELPGEGFAHRVHRLRSGPELVKSAAFTRDGRRLAIISSRRVTLQGLSFPTSAQILWEGAADLEAFSISPGSRWLFLAPPGEQGLLWDLDSLRRRPLRLPGLQSPVFVGPGGDWLASWSRTEELAWLWDLSAEPVQISLREHRGVFRAAFSPKGRWLATAAEGGMLRVWDLSAVRSRARGAPAEPSRTYQHDGDVLALAFSLDDRWLAAASLDQSVSVWDLSFSTEESLRSVAPRPQLLYEPNGAVDSLAISRDGWLASSSVGGTVRLVRLTSSGPLDAATTWTSGDRIRSIAFSPEAVPSSHWLITSGVFGILRWNLRIDELLDLACRLAGRNLTKDEWQQFLPGREYRQTCPVPSGRG